MRAELAAIVVLSAVTGCSSFTVRATVTSSRSQCETEAEAEPPHRLAGATISLSCPQGVMPARTTVIGRTNAQGELSVDEPSLGDELTDECEIVVETSRYRTRRFKLPDVCKDRSGNRCTSVVVAAEVVRDLPCI